MAYKETIELPVSDPLAACARLRKVVGVMSANMIDANRITISFDNRKIQGKRLAKLARPIEGGRIIKTKTKKPPKP